MEDVIFKPEQLDKATNNFSKENCLGKGGFGEVFKGQLFGTNIAVKRLHEGRDVGQFRQEANILTRLRHPHIVLLMGCTADGKCIVSEYMGGGSLHDRLKGMFGGPLTWVDRIRIASEMASALAYMHSLGVLHRDLKPANVLLDQNKGSKLSDVGLAKLFKPGEMTKGTTTWKVQGTIGYLDPHHIRSGQATNKSDIYSLGLVFLQLITGHTRVQDVHSILGKCNFSTPQRDLDKAVPVFLDRLDSSAGEWDHNIAHHMIRLALQCTERDEGWRPGLEESIQPSLQRLLEEAELVESERVTQQLAPARGKVPEKKQLAVCVGKALVRTKSLPLPDKLWDREKECGNAVRIDVSRGSGKEHLQDFVRQIVHSPTRAFVSEWQARLSSIHSSLQRRSGSSLSLSRAANQEVGLPFADDSATPDGVISHGNKGSPGGSTRCNSGATQVELPLQSLGSLANEKNLLEADRDMGLGRVGRDRSKDGEEGSPSVGGGASQGSPQVRPAIGGTVEDVASLETSSSRSASWSTAETDNLQLNFDTSESPGSIRSVADAMIFGSTQDRSACRTDDLWRIGSVPSWPSEATSGSVTPAGVDIILENKGGGWTVTREEMLQNQRESGNARHGNLEDGRLQEGNWVMQGDLECKAASYLLARMNFKPDSDLVKAVRLLEAAAARGNAGAQNSLGLCYFQGWGTRQNYSEAVRLFRCAIENGSSVAECNLGCCYWDGKGVAQDRAAAVRWFRKAARGGYALAELIMGICCLRGEADSESAAVEAVEWFSRAAERGDSEAQTHLGFCFADGIGVPKDVAKAARFWGEAAEQGHPVALNQVAMCYNLEKGVPQNHERAFQLFQVAAEMGQANAQVCLGNYYYRGREVAPNDAEAVRLFRLAIDSCEQLKELRSKWDLADSFAVQFRVGDPSCALQPSQLMNDFVYDVDETLSRALYSLGVCFANGHGVEQNYSDAVALYAQAAAAGNENAMYDLGVCYDRGRGVPQDIVEAVKRYRQAAEKGHGMAQFNLAVCLENEEGIGRDLKAAVDMYMLAANKGIVSAKFRLGLCYYYGRGVARDFTQAFRWWLAAAEDGLPNAMVKVAQCYSLGHGVRRNHEEAKAWMRRQEAASN